MENSTETDIVAIQRLIKENEIIRNQNASMKSTIFLLKSTVEAYTGKYNISNAHISYFTDSQCHNKIEHDLTREELDFILSTKFIDKIKRIYCFDLVTQISCRWMNVAERLIYENPEGICYDYKSQGGCSCHRGHIAYLNYKDRYMTAEEVQTITDIVNKLGFKDVYCLDYLEINL